MNGKKRGFRTFIFLAAFIAGGCAAPIGTISGSENGEFHDFLLVVPRREVYILNEWFKPKEDLQILASLRGMVEKVPVDLVTISVTEFPGTIAQKENQVDNKDGYILEYEGTKIVNIYYNSLSDHYIIQVGDPSGVGNGNGGNDNLPGIIIEW